MISSHCAAPVAWLASSLSTCFRFGAPIRMSSKDLPAPEVNQLKALTHSLHLQLCPLSRASRSLGVFAGFGPNTCFVHKPTTAVKNAPKGSACVEIL